MSDTVYCGAAKKCITPPQELLGDLEGLGKRRFSGEILDDIYVRGLAVKSGDMSLLILACELDKVPNPAKRLNEISAATGISIENILLFSTHIHTAPVMGARPDEAMNDPANKAPAQKTAAEEYERYFAGILCEAASDALTHMQPAKLRFNTGKSYINVNRYLDYYIDNGEGEPLVTVGMGANFEGPVDHDLFMMEVSDYSGAPIAYFANYAVHNVAAIWNDKNKDRRLAITGDIGGKVSKYLEERSGAVAIWSSGAAGDVNPIMYNEWPSVARDGRPSSYDTSGSLSYLLALDIMSARHYNDIRMTLMGMGDKSDSAIIKSRTAILSLPGKVCKRDGNRFENITGDGIPDYVVRVHTVSITPEDGTRPVVLCGISGELFSSIGINLKKAYPDKNIVIINHDCSLIANSGYIFDDATINRIENATKREHIPGYDEESHILPGYVEPALIKLVGELIK